MFATLSIYLIGSLVLFGNTCESKSSTRQEPVQGGVSQAAMTNPAQMKSETKSEPVAGPESSAASRDTCALIEKSEIASVQGVQVQQMQPTIQKHGDLEISQCYYTAISADGSKNLSVYLQVIQRDPKSARRDAVKEFWAERFGRESKGKKIGPPLPVSGIGDAAFWLGSSRGGALFVLQKDKVVRVTAGGENDAKAQIENSKALAKKVLARLG